MKKRFLSFSVSAILAGGILSSVAVEAKNTNAINHVIVISVDGLHQNDLDWFVGTHPASNMAALISQGVEYSNAQTPFPSDSFPGMVAMMTGGNPKTTGIYYDDGYSRDLVPCGCNSLALTSNGAEVGFFENLDLDFGGDGSTLTLDAGQGIAGLYPVKRLSDFKNPNNHPIFQLSGQARNLIDPNQLPIDPITTKRVYPHDYLHVNTVFEVAKMKGMRTAWSDKHPAYEILNGPSGAGIDDLFAPEINSMTNDPNYADWTKDNTLTQQYDAFKVQAVINWANGHDHAGNGRYGAPAIYGMNFQVVSTAQKLNMSYYTKGGVIQPAKGLGGYDFTSGNAVPGPVIQGALEFVDIKLGEIRSKVGSDTAIIVSAKHGQSPQNRADLVIINDGNMTAALDAAWNSAMGVTTGLVDHAMDDDGVLLWLKDHSQKAADFAKSFLMSYSGTGIGSDAAGNKVTGIPFTSAGLSAVYAGKDAASFMGSKRIDGRYPDVIGVARTGSVFAGGKLSKIAEHGGDATADRHVPIIVWRGNKTVGNVVSDPVETKQIAPTILKLLNLNPNKLQAVGMESTAVLPGL